MAELTVFVEVKKVFRFYEDKGGFLIARVSSKEFKEEFSIVGNSVLGEPTPGTELELKGFWQKKPENKYGPSFKFTEMKLFSQNPTKVFLKKFIKGLGEQTVELLFQTYEEEELVNILDNDPKQLLNVHGIGPKTIVSIEESWKKYRGEFIIRDIIADFQMTERMLGAVLETFSIQELNQLKENPYMLTNIKGIGFLKVDAKAMRLGISPYNTTRIIQGIFHIIKELEANNTVFSKKEFFDKAVKLLGIEIEYIEPVVKKVIDLDRLIEVDDDLVRSKTMKQEMSLYKKIMKRLKKGKNTLMAEKDVIKWIKMKEEKYGMTLSEQQRAALIKIADDAKVFFLLGYAGTGKSTVSKLIVELIEEATTGKIFKKNLYSKEEVVCAALSGIATDRIRNSTNRESMTIASMLQRFEFTRTLKDKRVFIIDECSMIDLEMMDELLEKIPDNAIIIMIGDPAQLPPIGMGAPFSDLSKSKKIPKVELTKIYRQSDDAVITLFANDIRNGRVPKGYDEYYDDFEFKKCEPSDVVHQISFVVAHHIVENRNNMRAGKWIDYIKQFQVITPMKKGDVGVINLNKMIQRLNQQGKQHVAKFFDKTFFMYDKVVHLKNEDMDVLTTKELKDSLILGVTDKVEGRKYRVNNGMLGVVSYSTEKNLYVYYPVEDIHVRYSKKASLDLIDLGYALTIHKTQGAEFDNLIIPTVMSQKFMLNNKLLYTAVTRAKKHVLLVGEDRAFMYACKNVADGERNTYLKHYIEEKE